MTAFEINFDGLVGPTHNYAGLSFGNIASWQNAQKISNPKAAALQGLKKMWQLHSLGIPQAVLPPQARPDLQILRRLGFTGTPAQILQRVAQENPPLLAAVYSASSMWTANAATISPSADTADAKVHFTPANLMSHFHRSLETATTARVLKRIFADLQYFVHHEPLPNVNHFSDEGAANHTRLCTSYEKPGLELFVFGRYGFDTSRQKPTLFPARQTYEASASIARLHQLDLQRACFIQQTPTVIDKGVFHNDVIAVGNGNVLLYHAHAFLESDTLLSKVHKFFGEELHYLIEVPDEAVSVNDAVQSYLFNSQLVSTKPQQMLLIAPLESQENPKVHQYLQQLVATKNPIKQVIYVDCRQSMKNGGGPACLRLRVVLTEQEWQAIAANVRFTENLYQQLCAWVEKHYRDHLVPNDLVDPHLLEESYTALDQLTQLLQLGAIYPFQTNP